MGGMSAISSMVWNRACYGGGEVPRQGDKRLAALLHFHGAAMNGGVLHATQFCSKSELREARLGYEYFRLHEAVALIAKAESLLKEPEPPGDFEQALDSEYYRVVADSKLSARFEAQYAAKPDDFAPVQ